jgi:hypothetical protein
LCIASAVDQGTNFVTEAPALDIGTDCDDLAGYFETQDGGRAGRGRVDAFALEDVGTVDTGGGYSDFDLA